MRSAASSPESSPARRIRNSARASRWRSKADRHRESFSTAPRGPLRRVKSILREFLLQLPCGLVWAAGQSALRAPSGSAPPSRSGSVSLQSTDSVWPSLPPGRFSPPIYGQLTLTYPVFRIWWDATASFSTQWLDCVLHWKSPKSLEFHLSKSITTRTYTRCHE